MLLSKMPQRELLLLLLILKQDYSVVMQINAELQKIGVLLLLVTMIFMSKDHLEVELHLLLLLSQVPQH